MTVLKMPFMIAKGYNITSEGKDKNKANRKIEAALKGERIRGRSRRWVRHSNAGRGYRHWNAWRICKIEETEQGS